MNAAKSFGHTSSQVPWSAGAETPRTPTPANTTDCHHHIYDSRFPWDPSASLHPGNATASDYKLLAERIGIKRHVLIQPSSYGFDNRCLLDALAQFGLTTARGIAVIKPDTTDREIAQLDAAGVRGIRITLSRSSVTTLEMAQQLANRLKTAGWHIQINGSPALISAAIPILSQLPVPIVFDHLAHAGTPGSTLFAAVATLLRNDKCWVKLSGAYVDSRTGPPKYEDSSLVARAYIKAAPHRLLWGTDWPHPSIKIKPDDALLFDLLADWTPNRATLTQILVDNPAKLFGFRQPMTP